MRKLSQRHWVLLTRRTSMPTHAVPIRIAALLVGVVPETLREYERLGLLRPQRNSVGQRVYNKGDLSQARRVLRIRIHGRTRGLRKGRV
jgi:hypothetical protein